MARFAIGNKVPNPVRAIVIRLVQELHAMDAAARFHRFAADLYLRDRGVAEETIGSGDEVRATRPASDRSGSDE